MKQLINKIVEASLKAKIIGGILTVVLVGGVTTGVIVYSQSQSADNTDTIEVYSNDDGNKGDKESQEVVKEDESKSSTSTTTQSSDTAKTDTTQPQQTDSSTPKSETKQAATSTQAVNNNPTPQPTVTHKASGYNAELTQRANDAILTTYFSIESQYYRGVKDYVLNGKSYTPDGANQNMYTKGEVRTVSVTVNENISNDDLYKCFNVGGSARNALGDNLGAANYAKVSCDGNGNAIITIYHMVCYMK